MRRKYGGIAQLVEHLPCKQGVSGSNPLTSTIMGSELSWLEHTPDKREVGGSSPLEPTKQRKLRGVIVGFADVTRKKTRFPTLSRRKVADK